MAHEQVVTPFDVSGGTDEQGKPKAVDYRRLTETFGTKQIDKALLGRFEQVTGHRPHRLLRRGKVFSHRDLNLILDKYEKGIPFFLYTGRGPSSDSMHVGHTIPFDFTKYLQDVFDVPVIIMLTDDEKFLHSPKLTLEKTRQFAMQNAMDIIAVGFDVEKTFIFTDTGFIPGGDAAAFFSNDLEISKKTTVNQIKGTFGFNDSNNVGEFAFPPVQSASAFATSFPFIFGKDSKKVSKIPCLIPCAIDQDPYFRQCRDIAPRLKLVKPAIIHSVFLPSLKGSESKMSASDADSSIFLSDKDKDIKKKIGQAFSGGQDTRELHRELGGRTEVDVAFQYLTFFLEDDTELEKIKTAYEKGEMESGEMKAMCTKVVQTYVSEFQERRDKVTPELLNEFMKPRQLHFRGMPAASEQVSTINSQFEELKAQLEISKARIKELEDRNEGLEVRYEELKARYEEPEVQKDKSEAQQGKLKAREESEAQKEELKAPREESEARKEVRNEELEARDEKSKPRNEEFEASKKKSKARIEELKARYEEPEAPKEELKAPKEESEARKEARIEELEAELARVRNENALLRDEKAPLRNELTLVRNENNEIASLRNENALLRDELGRVRNENAQGKGGGGGEVDHVALSTP